MNFYKHHLGDYAQATAHLSFVEDAAYSRLIRKYYAEEKPIPADMKAAQRLVGARTKEEKEAVETVLEEFFDLQEDGWHNKRCDTELGKANAQAETNRRIAEEREARRRQRIQNESCNESLNETNNESCNESESVRQPSQTPDTRHQTKTIPLSRASTTSTGVDAADDSSARDSEEESPCATATPGQISKAMRASSIDSNPADPRILALSEQGIGIETVEAACQQARRSKPGERIPPGYVIAILEGWARDSQRIQAKGAEQPSKEPQDAWWSSHEGIDRKGRELGLLPRSTESYPDFKARIFEHLRGQLDKAVAA